MSVGRLVGRLVGWSVGRSRKCFICAKRLILTYFFTPITFHASPHSYSFIQSFIQSFIHIFIHSSKTFIHKILIKRGALIGLHLALLPLDWIVKIPNLTIHLDFAYYFLQRNFCHMLSRMGKLLETEHQKKSRFLAQPNTCFFHVRADKDVLFLNWWSLHPNLTKYPITKPELHRFLSKTGKNNNPPHTC